MAAVTRTTGWGVLSGRLYGSFAGKVGTLALSGAGYEIGDGNDPATMAVLAAVSMTVAIYADALPFGAALYSATGQSSDSNGRLADIVSAALAAGTTYIVTVRNESDGEVWAWRMAAT